MDEDLDDELLALTQAVAPKKEKRKRQKTYASGSESDVVSDSDDSEDDAFADVKSWGADLMGDAKDRKRLASLTELERETILADRRKRIDLMHEHQELKARIGQKLGRRSGRTKDSSKGKELAKLREQRENRALKKAHYDDYEEDENEGQVSEDSDNYYGDEDHERKASTSTPKVEATFEDALKIQLKRSEIENWVNAPFFESAITGCLVRIAIGMNKEKKEQVYRIAVVLGIYEIMNRKGVGKYHRAYRFGKQMINTTLHVAHGKAEKEFLMDLASNGNFTEAEWTRYVKTVHAEGQRLIKLDHVEKKEKELLKARTYIFSNADIDEMVKKKRAFDKLPVNVASERLRLQQEYQEAVDNHDSEKQFDLKRRIDSLDEKVKDATTRDTKLEQFTSLNMKNRDINYREGREAEKASILAKKQKGDRAYDPFARRKTAPKHVINREENEEKLPEPPLASATLKPGRTTLSLESSPSFKATKVVIDDDSFLESIDISELEKDLQ